MDNIFYKNYYNSYAEEYQKLFDAGNMPFHEKIQMPIFQGLIEHKTYKAALDIGCGNGVYSKIMSKYAKIVHAVDISESMVAIAKNRNASANIEYICSDILSYNRKKKYDLVFAGFMPSYFSEIDKIFEIFDKMLSKNGSVIASMLHPVRMAMRISEQKKEYNGSLEVLRNNIYRSDFLNKENLLPLCSHYAGAFEDTARKYEMIIEEDYSPIYIKDDKNVDLKLNPSIQIFRLFRAEYFAKYRSFKNLRAAEGIKVRGGNDLVEKHN